MKNPYRSYAAALKRLQLRRQRRGDEDLLLSASESKQAKEQPLYAFQWLVREIGK